MVNRDRIKAAIDNVPATELDGLYQTIIAMHKPAVQQDQVQQSTPEGEDEETRFRRLLERNLDKFGFSHRVSTCFEWEKIQTTAELVLKTESELLKIRGFGRKSLNEVKESLTHVGLVLGMVFDWPPLEHLDQTEDRVEEKEKLRSQLVLRLSELGFSDRTYACLKRAWIWTVRDLVQLTRQDIREIKNLTPKSLLEIKNTLAGMGLRLGMVIDWQSINRVEEDKELRKLLEVKLSSLEKLSRSTRRNLKRSGFWTVGQLVLKRSFEVLKVKNLGRKSLRTIEETLGQMGLRFEMAIDWYNPGKEELESEKKNSHELLGCKLNELDLTASMIQCLRKAKIKTIGELTKMSKSEIRTLDHSDQYFLSNIEYTLELAGLALKKDVTEKAAKVPVAQTEVLPPQAEAPAPQTEAPAPQAEVPSAQAKVPLAQTKAQNATGPVKAEVPIKTRTQSLVKFIKQLIKR